MLLQDYDHHGRTWDLDPRTGLLAPASGRCHGFVHLGEAGTAALYADPSDEAATLWLQIGRRRWDCDAVTVRQSAGPDASRRFTVEDARGTALELRYPAPDPGPFDPTYDWMDAEADDFFLWASGRLADTAADTSARTTLLAHFWAGFLPS
ncbi:hypothetical protein [Streptomyces sp. NPDC051214]|uniref:hypothetical protein n=1 Tax=Streptomyces sp. NPDC051214 TaxID=3155282 RepID=UPI003422D573